MELMIRKSSQRTCELWPQQRSARDTAPSHESPLGAAVKPGSQAVQEKEPSVLVQTPVGHAPGIWHSSVSEKQEKTARLDTGYLLSS